jgi:hypothetical protein
MQYDTCLRAHIFKREYRSRHRDGVRNRNMWSEDIYLHKRADHLLFCLVFFLALSRKVLRFYEEKLARVLASSLSLSGLRELTFVSLNAHTLIIKSMWLSWNALLLSKFIFFFQIVIIGSLQRVTV